jgi:hypothetical protein
VTPSTGHLQRKFQQQFIVASGYPKPENFAGVEYTWWQNPTNPDSLRLTKTGYTWTQRHCGMKYVEIKISHEVRFRQLLQLERLLKEPYYIRGRTIVLSSERDAIMLQLHAGDLARYLDNLESNT